MTRRISPMEDDFERWADAIMSLYPITDYESFEKGFEDYFEEDGHIRRSRKFKDETFRHVRRLNPDVERRKVYLTKDRKVKRAYSFTKIGRIKSKVVRTREDIIRIKGKTRIIHRDKKGRFVSVKR